MFTDIGQVNEEFFKQFFGIVIGGKAINFRYFKKSSRDYVEEDENQIYPSIVIQDHTPTLREEWFIDLHTYVDGIDKDSVTAYIYQNPLWMSFMFDVSIVSKDYKENMGLKNYFLKTFQTKTGFILNKRLTGEDTVGDVVPYTIRATDIPRTDGVFETNYEFTLSVWVYASDPIQVDLITDIVITLEQGTL